MPLLPDPAPLEAGRKSVSLSGEQGWLEVEGFCFVASGE